MYLDPQRHGENLARDTAQLLAQLQQAGGKADVSELGDSFLLEHSFDGDSGAARFKNCSAKSSRRSWAELAPGQWQGPIESGYGAHLVLVSERTEGRMPALAEVREAVQREWANARRLEANEKFYQELLKRYAVTIERRQTAEEQRIPAGIANETRVSSFCVLLASSRTVTSAHEVRPAYLELRQTGPETYDVLWKVPGQGENLRLGIYVELPASCTKRHASREVRWSTTPSPNAGP